MSADNFFPGMSCTYTVAPGATAVALMNDLSRLLNASLGVLEEISEEADALSDTANGAYWAAVFLLRQSSAIVGVAMPMIEFPARYAVSPQPQQQGGAA